MEELHGEIIKQGGEKVSRGSPDLASEGVNTSDSPLYTLRGGYLKLVRKGMEMAVNVRTIECGDLLAYVEEGYDRDRTKQWTRQRWKQKQTKRGD